MRAIFLITMLGLTIVSWSQKAPIQVTNGYKVQIKTSAICEMCKEAIEYDLAFERGVKSAILNLDDKVVSVIYNEKRTAPDVIRKRITMVGYHADSLKRDPDAYDKLPECCKDGAHSDDNNKEHKKDN